MFIKRTIKRLMQHIAAAFGPHTRTPRDPQLLILMYHRILPADDERTLNEEPGMIVTPETLSLHIKVLRQYFEIVSLSDWMKRKAEGKPLPPKACAITFDDGWADNYEFAYPILKESNTPATIFLVTNMIGTEEKFWPERLSLLVKKISQQFESFWTHPDFAWLQSNTQHYQFSSTAPSQAELSELIADAKKLPDQEIHKRLNLIEKHLQTPTTTPYTSLLDWQQVDTMIHSGLIDIGSHTQNHIRLNNKASNKLCQDEIINSKIEIEQKINKKVTSFCYPNGDYYSDTLKLVQQTYDYAVTTQTGWNKKNTDNHQLQRIAIHQDVSVDKVAFLARISGWF